MLDSREMCKVHAEVSAEEGQGGEEDGYEGDDGHCCVGAGTCGKVSMVEGKG
jgi:hypothetical protein